jgi:hypothetical protein
LSFQETSDCERETWQEESKNKLAWTRRCPTRRRAPTGARCGRTGVAASDRARPAKALQTPPHSGYPVVAGQSRHRARRSRPGCPLTPPPRLVHIDRESKPAQPMPTGHQRRRALHQVHCNGVALAVSSAVHRRSRLPAVKALGTHQGLSQDGVQEERCSSSTRMIRTVPPTAGLTASRRIRICPSSWKAGDQKARDLSADRDACARARHGGCVSAWSGRHHLAGAATTNSAPSLGLPTVAMTPPWANPGPSTRGREPLRGQGSSPPVHGIRFAASLKDVRPCGVAGQIIHATRAYPLWKICSYICVP